MSATPGPWSIEDAFSVRGQAVIVTGAAGRIGRHIARAFAANGATVVLSDRASPELGRQVELLAQEHAADVWAQPGDLTSPDDLRGLVAAAHERCGRLDTVVHCGAIPFSSPLFEESEDRFDVLFHTNLRSAWLLARHAIPLLEQTRGSMISVASVNAHRALFPCSLYSATKSGLKTMSAELAAEFGPNHVRFNTISPGLIRGDSGHLQDLADLLHPPHGEQLRATFEDELLAATRSKQPLPEVGQPYDVAMAAVYLASPAARFVTGADLLVDGGKLHMFEGQVANGAGRGQWRRVREHLLSLGDDAWKGEKPHWLKA